MNTTTATTEALTELEVKRAKYIGDLRSFDWQFEYADDYSVVKRGQQALAQLRVQQKEVDAEGHIWLLFKPEDCRHKPDQAKGKANG